MRGQLLAVTVPLLAVAAPLLPRAVRRLVARLRGAVVARMPVLPAQELLLPEGPLVIALEGPRAARRCAAFLQLEDLAGRPVELAAVPLVARAASLAIGRVACHRVHLASPGRHVLRAETGREDPGALAVVVARPHGPGLSLHVLAVVVLAATVAITTAASILAVGPS